jgi:hypothetical protein
MALVLLFRSRSSPQGLAGAAPKRKAVPGRRPADSLIGSAKPIIQPPITDLPATPLLQTRLKIGKPNDSFEQEADRMADATMRMRDLEEQRTNGKEGPSPAQSLRSHIGLPPGSGEPLPDAVRSYFGPRFGDDFSRVRVHTDPRAAKSARALGAQAYTLGHDVVFDQGQYAPETKEGQRLLAHELAHVVQQSSGGISPMIQRHLFVHGDKRDIKAFLGLLEPASGLSLKHDNKTKKVTVTGSGGKPPQSSELASQLRNIIEDPKQDAELSLGRTEAGIRFGGFPSSLTDPKNMAQEIRIDQILALEKGAPGSGVVALAHEIIENYQGHNPEVMEMVWESAFLRSHEKAIKEEDVIAGELGHPGARRNDFELLMGHAPHRFLRGIRDEGQYFLIWDRSLDDPGEIVSHVRRVPRIRISTYTIEGASAVTSTSVASDSTSLSDAGLKQLERPTADLVHNPTASALVECFLSVWDSPNPDSTLLDEWAATIQSKLEEKVVVPATGRRSYRVSHFTRDRTRAVITIDRPDM